MKIPFFFLTKWRNLPSRRIQHEIVEHFTDQIGDAHRRGKPPDVSAGDACQPQEPEGARRPPEPHQGLPQVS